MRLLTAVVVLVGLGAVALGESVRVGAAVSLREVMGDLVAAYREAGGGGVAVAVGGSGQLMAQVRAGAEIDVVIFASRREMAALATDGLVDPATARDVAGSRLVLIVPRGVGAEVVSFEGLTRVPGRVAIGEPRSVPAGAYARQVFEHLGLDLRDRLVYGTNVRQVLDLVKRGEVVAGVVYATDAAVSSRVRVVAEAPAGSHDPVVYPAAVVATSKRTAEASRFVAFLTTARARELFVRRGFSTPAGPTTSPTDAARPGTPTSRPAGAP